MEVLPLLVSCLLFLILLQIVKLMVYQYTYWKKRKVPHLEPGYIVGNNSPILFRNLSIPEHAQNLYNSFPNADYFGMFDFNKPVVLVKKPELIRDIGIKSFEHFVDHEGFVTEEMDPIVGRNIFSLTGQRWKDVRSTLSPSYTAVKMKIMFELIAECSKTFVQYFLENPEEAKNIECKDAFTRYTNDIIATTAFGIKVNSMKDKDNDFFRHGKNSVLFGTYTMLLKVIIMRFLPKIARMFDLTFFPKSSDRFFKNLIIDTIKLRKEKNIYRPDMLQLMIESMDKKDGISLSINDVLGNSLVFFIAGFDTTSSLLAFVCHELAANPDVQEKLYQEINQKTDNNADITYESLMDMKYISMVIDETLRKYPTAPITNRRCTKDYTFTPAADGCPEYTMEKNTIIMIPIYGFHHDPKYYPEPEKFIPERFSDENKDKIDPYTYLSFGLGPRKCIGNRFALMQTKIVLYHVVKNFNIKFTEKTENPIKFSCKGFNMNAKNGIWLKFEERKKTN